MVFGVDEFNRVSFNGAMNFHSWKSNSAISVFNSTNMLQWSHEFSFMEMAYLGESGRKQSLRFNGAMNFHSWKFAPSILNPVILWLASMEP